MSSMSEWAYTRIQAVCRECKTPIVIEIYNEDSVGNRKLDICGECEDKLLSDKVSGDNETSKD